MTLAPGAAAPTRFTAFDQHLFNEGRHYRLYEKLGAHALPQGGVAFAVWAPNARAVSVIGDFNGWDRGAHPMSPVGNSGVWECTVPQARPGQVYKYHIASHYRGYASDRADPLAFRGEQPPRTGSVVHGLAYAWHDQDWMASRAARQRLDQPMSIYEVHLGSWMRVPHENNRWLTYAQAARRLADYCVEHGFTHVELLPICEHPFDGSWGYQTLGYFAPTSRFGTPQDFMAFVDHLHRRGIGVILDWVPSHFPTDGHGLAYFDGTHLYEHADPRQGFHPDWKSAIFNYDRLEVRSFLISSACFWLEKYHIDALRVDAVASMLYLDYARRGGEWIPNVHGGHENLGAIAFLRELNTEVYRAFPGVQTIAEESTAWPMVSRPVDAGGLGFGLKWDMGWMHDTLRYFSKDPVYRKHHHNDLTFRGVYMFSENYALPLSHDEVVHGKGSLLSKMPGDDWQKFANLRLLLVNQWMNPGKKLLFMGCEFGQWREWDYQSSLDWHLTEFAPHRGVQRLIGDLNRLYRELPALHTGDCDPMGFEWIDTHNADTSTLCLMRKATRNRAGQRQVAVLAMNCTPVPRHGFRVGVPVGGEWREVLNSDALVYGGSGMGNMGVAHADATPAMGRPYSLQLTLPPLGALVLTPA